MAKTKQELKDLMAAHKAAQQAKWTEEGRLDAAIAANAPTFTFEAWSSDENKPVKWVIDTTTGEIKVV